MQTAPRRALPFLAVLDRPRASYHLIMGSTLLLLAIGLVMVLSTSSATQLTADRSPYSVFVHQAVGAAIGLALMLVLSRTPPRLLRTLAKPLMWVAIAGLLVVFVHGTSAYGAERWVQVAGIQIQPSEFAKLALLIWGADLLARKEELRQLSDWRALLVPLLPGATLLCMLVMRGDDLGTTFLLLVIVLTLLWVLGTPGRLFACMLGLIVFALLMLTVMKTYRAARLTGFLHPSTDPTGRDQQSIQGKWAIGSGGLFGVGLGESMQKWGWVPNASSDFIFAILGEELGLIGTACVVFLYGGIAYAGLRVARRMTEPFMRLAAAGITVWIVVQALVNICAVIGLLPITGVPLPLISQGLSSLLVTLAAIGVLLSLARREPAALEARAAAKPKAAAAQAGPRDHPTGPPGRAPAAGRRPSSPPGGRAGPPTRSRTGPPPRPAASRLSAQSDRPGVLRAERAARPPSTERKKSERKKSDGTGSS